MFFEIILSQSLEKSNQPSPSGLPTEIFKMSEILQFSTIRTAKFHRHVNPTAPRQKPIVNVKNRSKWAWHGAEGWMSMDIQLERTSITPFGLAGYKCGNRTAVGTL
ncbi:hypothetical protein AVEN_190539-1 [Araneus ventricosus]|uniref:Uncharacterized protein n=1 Tax=Araneus ventricosus TaxID=182803 RepID=A0A4Y2CEC7_ARAVE|nr:hypothetical protein AVEN_190539-1 [Araneus ventricosus]